MIATAADRKSVVLSHRRAVPVRRLRARFDSAATTDDNRRHWANADSLSPDAAASPEVRRTLRMRCRYEVANNSYAKGIVLTLANDTVGTGPRLQMLTGDAAANRQVEREFDRWARAVSLAEKLRTMRMARVQDGEAFAILANNPALAHAVKLDLRLVEADQVTSPFGGLFDDTEVDGVVLDEYGNPVAYRVLAEHPGALGRRFRDEYFSIPASHMIHVFRMDRPGQHRGVPEITPALPLFAQLRRFTLAVISAAEAAADFAGILYTDAPANGEADSVEPMDSIELERNMLLTMPGGWKMAQVEPMQPATTYAEFKKEILNEIVRCICMPYNIAAGNSSGYNYASGRLDHQTYFKCIRVEQSFMAERVLDRILAAWLWEYALAVGAVDYVPGEGLERILPDHQWFWDGFEHVDPAKEATAAEKLLKAGLLTEAEYQAKRGVDWEDHQAQRQREAEGRKRRGLPQPWDSAKGAAATAPEAEAAPVADGEEE